MFYCLFWYLVLFRGCRNQVTRLCTDLRCPTVATAVAGTRDTCGAFSFVPHARCACGHETEHTFKDVTENDMPNTETTDPLHGQESLIGGSDNRKPTSSQNQLTSLVAAAQEDRVRLAGTRSVQAAKDVRVSSPSKNPQFSHV